MQLWDQEWQIWFIWIKIWPLNQNYFILCLICMIQIYTNRKIKVKLTYNKINRILIHQFLKLLQQALKVDFILIFNNFSCITHYKVEETEPIYKNSQGLLIILDMEQVDISNNIFIRILIFLDLIMTLISILPLMELLDNKLIIQD